MKFSSNPLSNTHLESQARNHQRETWNSNVKSQLAKTNLSQIGNHSQNADGQIKRPSKSQSNAEDSIRHSESRFTAQNQKTFAMQTGSKSQAMKLNPHFISLGTAWRKIKIRNCFIKKIADRLRAEKTFNPDNAKTLSPKHYEDNRSKTIQDIRSKQFAKAFSPNHSHGHSVQTIRKGIQPIQFTRTLGPNSLSRKRNHNDS